MEHLEKKTLLMRTFNQQFVDFIQDVIRIFPDNHEIKASLTSIEAIKKANPALIPRIWAKYIYRPYQDKIDHGHLQFFFEKNYADDLTHLANAEKVMSIIDKIRQPIATMDDTNQAHTMKYIQVLSKLSAAYAEAANL